jgi:hypothetical protein
MPLQLAGVIEIPRAAGSAFDHGAFDPKTGRVFVAHTARNGLEVIDPQTGRHVASLDGFPEAAGVVADSGQVLVTNRGSAELVWLDAATLKEKKRFNTAPRPNGVAIVARSHLAVAACIGDEGHGPELQVIDLASNRRWAIPLPGRPRWCVPDAAGERIFLAIRDPSMVLVARLPDLGDVQHWPLPSPGAHGLDIDQRAGCLYAACDGGALIAVSAATGEIRAEWPLTWATGCHLPQSGERSRACRYRGAGPNPDHRAAHRHHYLLHHGGRCADHRPGPARPSLRLPSPSRGASSTWSKRPARRIRVSIRPNKIG